jgi:hypothetical protein
MATWCLYDKAECQPRVVFMDVPADDEDLLARLRPLFKGAKASRYDFDRVDDLPAPLIARILHGDGRHVSWREITTQTSRSAMPAPARASDSGAPPHRPIADTPR